MSETTNNMNVGSQLPNIGAEIKQIDSNNLEGSNKGDHRSGQVNVPAVPQPGPRGETGQAGC